jgi:DNA-binding CsgD family transcriptional regulator
VGSKILLTHRERDVLELVAKNRTNPQIGLRLGIRADSVKFHLQSIFVKLGVTSRQQAAEMLHLTRRRPTPARKKSTPARPRHPSVAPTPRELEAAVLRSADLSNAQVAITMGVRRDTAKRWARAGRQHIAATERQSESGRSGDRA